MHTAPTIHRSTNPTMSPVAAVVLPSRLDVHEVDELAARVEAIIRGGANHLILRAGKVRHTDQAGLDFLRRLCRELDEHGMSYAVHGISLTIRISLELNDLQAELAQLESRMVVLDAA